MRPPIPLKGGLEHDCLTGWRRVLCYAKNRKGIRKWAKRHFNKRVRRCHKNELNHDRD